MSQKVEIGVTLCRGCSFQPARHRNGQNAQRCRKKTVEEEFEKVLVEFVSKDERDIDQWISLCRKNSSIQKKTKFQMQLKIFARFLDGYGSNTSNFQIEFIIIFFASQRDVYQSISEAKPITNVPSKNAINLKIAVSNKRSLIIKKQITHKLKFIFFEDRLSLLFGTETAIHISLHPIWVLRRICVPLFVCELLEFFCWTTKHRWKETEFYFNACDLSFSECSLVRNTVDLLELMLHRILSRPLWETVFTISNLFQIDRGSAALLLQFILVVVGFKTVSFPTLVVCDGTWNSARTQRRSVKLQNQILIWILHIVSVLNRNFCNASDFKPSFSQLIRCCIKFFLNASGFQSNFSQRIRFCITFFDNTS